ncbi:MAG: 50S ribosomal protein L11 [Anaerotruncus massiliensis (ex Togo et al. 2019)]
MAFTKEFNERTKNGDDHPGRHHRLRGPRFSFVTKTRAHQEAAGIDKASGAPNKTKVAKITREQARKIAEQKICRPERRERRDRDQHDCGTARSMGVEVED